jgi:hypothetical protein
VIQQIGDHLARGRPDGGDREHLPGSIRGHHHTIGAALAQQLPVLLFADCRHDRC